MALDGVLLGRLRLSDRIKPGAEQAVRELRAGVSNLVMLTGIPPPPVRRWGASWDWTRCSAG
ncbi:MAG: hypothetical protein ACLT8E_06150 [Akkermansia sp.]